MQRLDSGAVLFSATDLTNHLACEHLTAQRRGIVLGERARPRPSDDPHADLVRRRGERHEAEQLERLIAEAGGDWADLRGDDEAAPPSPAELANLAARTAQEMRRGTRLIYQATFVDGGWLGRPDFLRRVEDLETSTGPVYEVLDTKLARQVRPHVVHQLCLYTRLAGAVQGVEPGHAWVILGDGRHERVEIRRYAALHRRAAARLGLAVTMPPTGTYPEPTGHCPICAFGAECDARRRADDHLSLVAGARRDQRRKLIAAGVSRLAELAALSEGALVAGLGPERLSLLHHQATLQEESRCQGRPTRRHLTPEAERGYARIPPPSPGDVFFDLEGDPYATADGGIEYLWGWSTTDGYDCTWAHTRAEEGQALRRFAEVVEERRRRHPDLHVFHYGAHEASRLRSLAIEHATCERIVDDWLRRGVLVDLYAVVRQALQVGEESYSLKALERHHGFRRENRSIREGGGSIVAYETWLEAGDDGILEEIRAYNRDDCESTASLLRWLREMRGEAERKHGVDFDELMAPPADAHQPPAWLPRVEALVARLHASLPDDPAWDQVDEAERRLLGHLLLYHYRESKPEWWAFFDRSAKTAEELVDEPEAVGLLELDVSVPPVPVKRSLEWTYRFPPQEVKLSPGGVIDPATGGSHKLVRLEDDHLVLGRKKGDSAPDVRALIAPGPIDAAPLREAIVAVAESVLAGEDRFPGVRAMLRGELPRLSSGRLGPATEDLIGATLGLDRSCLTIQGPPGTGKTYNSARMVLAALRARRRVAITAPSHAAIQNLLRAVETHAVEEGVVFAGVYKGAGYESPVGLVEGVEANADCTANHRLVAGTPWLLARNEHADAFDLLVADEAGQLALAAAVAAGRCATSIVLLGDPQQLPQVNQATHPGGAGASALEHVLDGADVVPAERGVLLDVSWRMHPHVCAFVSERSYEGRLSSRDACSLRRIDATGALTGAGLRVIEVPHEGRSQDSPEEADEIAAACRGLLSGDAKVTDDEGCSRTLGPEDILVVAPYNLAVSRIRSLVPAGVRVGTVDRFQGQEAPVVFFAMTSSAGEDVPRGLDFVFDRNRLNVAISRAQCLAVLVHSPRLLDADCRTLAQMALVDGACRFAELAEH